MLGLGATKAVVLVLMAILTLGVCMLPLLVRKMAVKHLQQHSTQMFMSGCLCFGGGVLMATVFLHLLPEVRFYMNLATSYGFIPNVPYPLAELLVCIGFFFIYICEEIVHTCVHKHNESHRTQDLKMNIPVNEVERGNSSCSNSNNDSHVDEKFLANKCHEAGATHPPHSEALSMMRTLVVVMALSLHSIMEGLALGLVHEPKDVWVLFGALSAHKLIIGFCMAMELLENGATKASFLVSMIVFSLASPLGGLVGALVVSIMTETTPAGVLVPTILQGLSAGTILYVTFCEVLERERAKQEIGFIRMWTFLLGFVFMAVLQVIDSFVEEPLSETQVSPKPELLSSLLPEPSLPPHYTEPW